MSTCAACGRELPDLQTPCGCCAGMDDLAVALRCIGTRPCMYFADRGEPSLSEVWAFVVGYQHGQRGQGDPGWFQPFTHWVATRYKVDCATQSGFTLIYEHVGGDDGLAFAEFFRLLPGYIRDMRRLGAKGIDERWWRWENRRRKKK